MTKATTAGPVGDVEQFRAQHPSEGLLAAEDIESAAAAPTTDDTEITSPGWDASAMPKWDRTESTQDTQARFLDQAESYVVANPIKAVAMGLVAGVVLGRML